MIKICDLYHTKKKIKNQDPDSRIEQITTSMVTIALSRRTKILLIWFDKNIQDIQLFN